MRDERVVTALARRIAQLADLRFVATALRGAIYRTGFSGPSVIARVDHAVMNGPFGAYLGASISFSRQFTSRVVPIVLRCIVTCPLSVSTIAPIVPMSPLYCTLLFSLPFPRP